MSFSIYDYDNPIPDEANYKKPQVQQQQQPTKSNNELTAASQTKVQTEEYFSIFDSICLV